MSERRDGWKRRSGIRRKERREDVELARWLGLWLFFCLMMETFHYSSLGSGVLSIYTHGLVRGSI